MGNRRQVAILISPQRKRQGLWPAEDLVIISQLEEANKLNSLNWTRNCYFCMGQGTSFLVVVARKQPECAKRGFPFFFWRLQDCWAFQVAKTSESRYSQREGQRSICHVHLYICHVSLEFPVVNPILGNIRRLIFPTGLKKTQFKADLPQYS